jgi:hypothetical protein
VVDYYNSSTQETEVGELLEPRSLRPVWVTFSKTLSQKEKKENLLERQTLGESWFLASPGKKFARRHLNQWLSS